MATKTATRRKTPAKSSTRSSSSSWDRSTASTQELADYAEGRADARGGYQPQPPASRSDRAYMAGYRGTRSSSSSSSGSKNSGRSSSSRSKSSSSRRPARSSGGRGPVRRSGANARRRLVAPAERQLTSGLVLIGAAAGVAVLYNLLVHAKTTSTVIDRITDSVGWLDSTRPIPYRHN